MLLDPSKTVRELALASPNATRVFEKARIDYCCGGDRLLGDACEAAGLEIHQLEQMMKESADPKRGTIDFQELTLVELIRHILNNHHEFTRHEIARLEVLVEKVVTAHGQNHAELLAVKSLLGQLFRDLTQHMFKEEAILFPFVAELEQAAQQKRPRAYPPFGTVNNPIRVMTMEHDTAGDILRELRKLTSDYAVPADACASYQTLYRSLEALENDLHQHIHLENNILFPRAIELEAGV